MRNRQNAVLQVVKNRANSLVLNDRAMLFRERGAAVAAHKLKAEMRELWVRFPQSTTFIETRSLSKPEGGAAHL